VLATQGWNAWPSCSRKLGLTRADAGGGAGTSRSTSRKASNRSVKHSSKHSAAQHSSKHSSHSSKHSSVKHSARATNSAPGTYVVRAGDTLSEIAVARHVKGGWKALYMQNKRTVGANPDVIQIGQRLSLSR
jgi:resuscitation-promoting factor RpfA